MVDYQEILEKTIETISETLAIKKDEITLESNLRTDFKVSSFDYLRLVKEFEDEFDITVSDEEALSLIDVQTIVNFIQSKLI